MTGQDVPEGRLLAWAGADPESHGMLAIPGRGGGRLRLVHATWRQRAALDPRRSPHVHDVWHLILIHAGCGSVLIDDEALPVAAPCLLLTAPGEPHVFSGLPGESVVYSEATFTARSGSGQALRLPWSGLLSAWSGQRVPAPAHLLLAEDAAAGLAGALQELVGDLAADRPELPALVQGHLARLLFLVLRALVGAPGAGDRLEAARRFIAASAADAPTLAACARLAGCGVRAFDRAFKARYGLPPLRYRAEVLAGRAEALLREGDLPLAEVAARCGFADAQYFNRWFARRRGLPPGRWRRQARAGT
jgi:AraC-like DNA-binding protein